MNALRQQLDTTSRGHAARCRAFTITELLVVITIIILLLTIIIVAVNQAMKTAQGTNTQFLMSSIRQGLDQFREDHGYLPPVLGDPTSNDPMTPRDLRLLDPFAGSYQADVQSWYSITSLADYLVGPDDRTVDGYGNGPGGSEIPPTGIRNPGIDGVWGATIYGAQVGDFDDRNPVNEGQVFGPYLDLKDDRLLGGWDAANNIVVFPGDVPAATFAALPKVIVDYWGQPIHYYRRPYPPNAIKQSYRAVDYDDDGATDQPPTLSDVYLLRPFTIRSGSGINARFADASGDKASSRAVNTAEFALFSSGADRAFNPDVRFDDPMAPGNTLGTDLSNEDNIVELGQ